MWVLYLFLLLCFASVSGFLYHSSDSLARERKEWGSICSGRAVGEMLAWAKASGEMFKGLREV